MTQAEQVKREHPRVAFMCEGLGLCRADAFRLVAHAGWDRDRFDAEAKSPDWKEKLMADVQAADEREAEASATRRLLSVARNGPAWATELSKEEMLAKVSSGSLTKLACDYMPSEHGGRLIVGPTGLGKSVACLVVVRRLIVEQELRIEKKNREEGRQDWEADCAPRHRFVWARAFDLANASLEHKLGNGEAEEIKAAKDASFLVLDDIGWESKRASGDDAVLQVIAERYDRGLFTLATSGWKVDALVERYGDAVVRRIVETGGKNGKVLDLWPETPK